MNGLIGILSLRDKLFKKSKSSRLNINCEIYQKTRNDFQRLIKYKKKKYFEENLAENIAKPKKLWQALKSIGLPNKKTSSTNICLENKDYSTHFHSSLAENLVLKLANPPNNFGMELVNNYYKKYSLKDKLIFV